MDDFGAVCDDFGMVGGLVGCVVRLLGTSGESGGFYGCCSWGISAVG